MSLFIIRKIFLITCANAKRDLKVINKLKSEVILIKKFYNINTS